MFSLTVCLDRERYTSNTWTIKLKLTRQQCETS